MKVFEAVGSMLFDAVINDMNARPSHPHDWRCLLAGGNTIFIATGCATGDEHAVRAASIAVSSVTLEKYIARTAGILVDITGPADLVLQEIYEAADPDVNRIFGATLSKESMENQLAGNGCSNGSWGGV